MTLLQQAYEQSLTDPKKKKAKKVAPKPKPKPASIDSAVGSFMADVRAGDKAGANRRLQGFTRDNISAKRNKGKK